MVTYNKTEVIFEDLCKNMQLDQGNLIMKMLGGKWKLLIISSALMAVVMFFFTSALIPEFFELNGERYTSMGVYWCFLSGLIAGLAVGLLTGYYTSENYGPVKEVAKSCETGVATNEPVNYAIRTTIEHAIHNLIYAGIDKDLWKFKIEE